ncbi:putative holin-like toxin [Niallia taxi]
MSDVQVALTTGLFVVALINLVVVLIDKMSNKK